jgi:hypothetical protein
VKNAQVDARRVQPALKIFTLSAQNDVGVAAWYELLESEREHLLSARHIDQPETAVSQPTQPARAKKPMARRVEGPKSKVAKVGKK